MCNFNEGQRIAFLNFRRVVSKDGDVHPLRILLKFKVAICHHVRLSHLLSKPVHLWIA